MLTLSPSLLPLHLSNCHASSQSKLDALSLSLFLSLPVKTDFGSTVVLYCMVLEELGLCHVMLSGVCAWDDTNTHSTHSSKHTHSKHTSKHLPHTTTLDKHLLHIRDHTISVKKTKQRCIFIEITLKFTKGRSGKFGLNSVYRYIIINIYGSGCVRRSGSLTVTDNKESHTHQFHTL